MEYLVKFITFFTFSAQNYKFIFNFALSNTDFFNFYRNYYEICRRV